MVSIPYPNNEGSNDYLQIQKNYLFKVNVLQSNFYPTERSLFEKIKQVADQEQDPLEGLQPEMESVLGERRETHIVCQVHSVKDYHEDHSEVSQIKEEEVIDIELEKILQVELDHIFRNVYNLRSHHLLECNVEFVFI